MEKSITFATFLAPNMLGVYQFITSYVGEKVGISTELITGTSFDDFAGGRVDAGFICGLPYVNLAEQSPSPVEPSAAPVLQGERYRDRPVYYSDVIVRRGSSYRSFADLRGCSWSYNDPDSQSGYGITRYWLAKMGEKRDFFGKVVQAGFHQKSIRMVAAGEVDASAIDSQVLAIELRDNPELIDELQVIDSLGPSTIQPFVVAAGLPASLKSAIQSIFLQMGEDPIARSALDLGLIQRFAAVDDASYNDIREMLRVAKEMDMLSL